MKTFGENLKILMTKNRVGVAELAKAIGEPAKTVQEWAGIGARTPRKLEKIKKLAEFFGVSTHFLLFGEEDPRSGLGALLNKTEIHTGLYEISIKKISEKKYETKK
jgi:transcriptional regulator with XRE-family HTH domain